MNQNMRPSALIALSQQSPHMHESKCQSQLHNSPRNQKSPPRNPGAGYFYVFMSGLTHRHHENPAGAAIDIDQAFAGGSRTNQRLTGAFHGEIQAGRPCDSKIAVDFHHVVVQNNLDQLFLRTVGFNTELILAVQTEIEQALAAGNR